MRIEHSVRQHGFTLLEVLVALTITGMALGALFAVIGGNKRLAWRAEQALLDSVQARSLINFAQLNDQRGELTVDLDAPDLQLYDGEPLEDPERKTRASQLALRAYELVDANGATVARGTYWVELDLPE